MVAGCLPRFDATGRRGVLVVHVLLELLPTVRRVGDVAAVGIASACPVVTRFVDEYGFGVARSR